jgi:hypothetical protein
LIGSACAADAAATQAAANKLEAERGFIANSS